LLGLFVRAPSMKSRTLESWLIAAVQQRLGHHIVVNSLVIEGRLALVV